MHEHITRVAFDMHEDSTTAAPVLSTATNLKPLRGG